MRKKRVWCLYRVSGKKQVSADDDIPVQRKSCLDFTKTKPDWEVTNELYEKGVSGWSKKAEDRDEMNVIREGAINKKFDVLLVFMYDRIGRREDETPLVVQFLIEQGVEIWSVQEGQTKIEQHSDILINYIRYWQSSGESKKTSLRVREAKKQLSEKGYYQGGRTPLGYKLIETEQPHWKNKDKMTKELAIDENQAEIIKLIFNMYVDKHMGARKIARFLNENGYRNQSGNKFGQSVIQRLLRNSIYIGKARYVGFNGKEGDTQPYNENLRIVSDEQFKMVEQIMAKRISKVKVNVDKSTIPLAGKLMFSGLAYCKCCGSKLLPNYYYREFKNKKTKIPYTRTVYRYKCGMKDGILVNEHKQCIWGSTKYDTIIINTIKKAISQLDVKSFIETSVNQRKKQITQKEKNVKNVKKEIEQYKKELIVLNGEISKALLQKSKFTPEQLSSAITSIEEQIQQATKNLHALSKEIIDENENYADVNYIVNELNDWGNKFDNADNDLKKAMLSRVVNKVYFDKEEVKVEFNLAFQECLNSEEFSGSR